MALPSIRPFPYDADLSGACRGELRRFPFLLESAARSGAQGRCDLLFVRDDTEALVLQADGSLTGPHAYDAGGDFFTALDAWWRAEHSKASSARERSGLPFTGGWFLFLGYELAGQVEPGLKLPRGGDLPIAFAARTPAAVVRDHGTVSAVFVSEPGVDPAVYDRLKSLTAARPYDAGTAVLATALQEEAPERYLAQVERARRYVQDGDIFQANLSRLWSAELAPGPDAVTLYRRLRHANPAPFAGLVLHEGAAIISSSPERLVRVAGERVDTRPIAGTRPRSPNPERDAALIRELIEHPKERAEHVMLLDMERNDLGRIAATGSVRVDELMVVESYAHVHHIVSNVEARLKPGTTPGSVIRAVFPGGTITGCPKVRCMEIIAELEQAPREAYTGAMGYLDLNGDMDLNILIRTLKQKGRRLEFRAGAGIVADSIPENELQETRAKARGLARALGADA
ncbi:MAG TPA: aminodeoxychorismate synthase component I [Gammaproteobacteria bacterium]|nr:aminodeoxychorismate synthase component I [Gammaproteobacteria bacterium]